MEKSYKVSQINAYIKGMFEQDVLLSNLWVEGEVSNCKYHPSGHLYFTLKDSDGQIACVMFSSARRVGLRFLLREGMNVRVRGSISVYDRTGSYQIYVSRIEQDGIGRLYEEYEIRKRNLQAEGLFDSEHKRRIPVFPKRVGIVTASSGAALQDILNVLRRRNPYVQPVLAPAQVQGDGAAESVVRAIKRLERYGMDVMIVGRGGGSIEDLWAFNEEIVARAVYACDVPIISCVGHETDTTIIDYVADLRAPTPSAAAELAVCEASAVEARLVDTHSALVMALLRSIEEYRTKAEQFRKALRYNHPSMRLQRRKEQLERLTERLRRSMHECLREKRHRMEVAATRLQGVSPLNKISKGYGFVTDAEGHPLATVESVCAGESIRVYLTDGELMADVTKVTPTKR